jgi:hypothetical protein
MNIDMKDKSRGEHLVRLIMLLLLLAILLAPPFSQGVMKFASVSSFEAGSLILTTKPEASFPDDWAYCYLDDATISICVLTMNQDINLADLNQVIDEFSSASITITFTGIEAIEEVEKSYLDYDLEQMSVQYRMEQHADIVLVLTYLQGVESAGYGDLGGYANVNNHFACVLVPKVYRNFGLDGVNCIAIHEVAHCLGYWHSPNPDCIMYPHFSGVNDKFTDDTVGELYRLHHAGD